MKIENPFESGHIRNYILLYASVVVIMILFFIASTLFNNNEEKIEKKNFPTDTSRINKAQNTQKKMPKKEKKFKLLDKAY
ncbi:hypothetical protein [Sulfurimonas sp.]